MFDQVVSAANQDGLFVEFVFGFPDGRVAPNGENARNQITRFHDRLACT